MDSTVITYPLRHLGFLLLAVTIPLPALAQSIDVSGQVRPRSEYRDPATGAEDAEFFTSLRTRLSARYTGETAVSAFIQLQDVRFLGEEASTLGDFSADALDMHQAWVQLGRDEAWVSVRAGRQEAAYGGERLVGAVGWAQQGRSFDGARVRVNPWAAARVDGLAFQLSESASAVQEFDAVFWGAYAVVDVSRDHTLDLFVLHQENEIPDSETDQWTSGLRWAGGGDGWAYRVEGAWQTGQRLTRDVDAYLLAARVGRDFAGGRLGLTLWADWLSGSTPGDEEVGAFDTLFGTNHKFYGYADLFLDIPLNTAGRGLVDLAVKGRGQIDDDWGVEAALHRFSVAEDEGLDSGGLATELDLVVTRSVFEGLQVSGGASYVFADDALGPVRGIDEDVTFAYLMLDVVL
jgi:hypothetical protein